MSRSGANSAREYWFLWSGRQHLLRGVSPDGTPRENSHKKMYPRSFFSFTLPKCAQKLGATKSQYGGRALDWFFSRPIFSSSDFVAQADIPVPTAKRILCLVRDNGLPHELRPANGRRPAVLAFPELLNICEGKSAFEDYFCTTTHFVDRNYSKIDPQLLRSTSDP